MPVFISHRTVDDGLAQHVASRLRSVHSIECYLDDIDQELGRAQGTPAITALIVRRLNQCTNLLAVVTENTKGSWWVPFEIGVARQAPRVITTVTNQADASLPEFLLEWPRLNGTAAVDEFARIYKAQRWLLQEQVIEKRAVFTDQVSAVNQFHWNLKASLGQ